MAVSYTSTDALLRSAFSNSLVLAFPELQKVYFDEFKRWPELYSKYTFVDTSDMQTYSANTVGELPIWASKSEGAEYTYSNSAQGTRVDITPTTYHGAFDISEELMEDNLWKPILSGTAALATSGKVIVEDVCADLLNNAFSGGTAGTDGGDLCSSSHDLINSGSTGDNADTAAFDADGLEALYLLADNVVDEANKFVLPNYDTLVIPPALRREAEEMVGSTLTPESNNNAINIYRNKIKTVVVNPYLSSATAWFLVDSASPHKGVTIWRKRPMFRMREDTHSGNPLFIGRLRLGTGHFNWQGILGSTGAG